MIKINLLPVRASKKRELGRQWLVLFALVVVGTLVGNYFWMSETDKKLDAVRARIVKYEQDVATLNKIIGEVKNIKKEKAEMEQKLGILKKLREGRTGPVRVMDELATVIPQKVWLTSWEEAQGGVITFTGSGASLEEVSSFLKKLKGSKFFTNPTLKNSHLAGENKVDFTITCSVKYSA